MEALRACGCVSAFAFAFAFGAGVTAFYLLSYLESRARSEMVDAASWKTVRSSRIWRAAMLGELVARSARSLLWACPG